MEEGAVPRADRERAPPPDRRVPGPADELMSHHDCTEHSRSALLRKAAAQAGEGKLAGLPPVGYTNADQSHFTSRHYWEVGDTDPRLQTGWLGRYLDHVGKPDNPLQGVSLDGELSPSLATAKKPVAALSGAGEYSFWAPGVWGQVEERMLAAIGSLGSSRGHDKALAGARAVTFQSHRLRQQLEPFNGGFQPPRSEEHT